ncbi:hypothetical protein HV823_05040 [Rhizobium sp. DBTS2]|uniref:Uncharacterized protein n=2 Tax=Mycoplana rhizolycopersici TaxID=2746702 RepID=A0ABX2QCB5_9HYPH|nr:hypothetical protein [Rhizobium rhizolycopersici]
MDKSEHPDDETSVDVLFRNGNLTVFGIVLAFSLGFLNTWTNNPNDWQVTDLPTLALIAGGIVFPASALWRLLQRDSLKASVFASGNRRFAIGLALTSIGMMLAICVDIGHMLL